MEHGFASGARWAPNVVFQIPVSLHAEDVRYQYIICVFSSGSVQTSLKDFDIFAQIQEHLCRCLDPFLNGSLLMARESC